MKWMLNIEEGYLESKQKKKDKEPTEEKNLERKIKECRKMEQNQNEYSN